MIKAIVCVDNNWGIGKKDGLLFNIPADMKHFKEITTGKICVFGANTYKSLRKRPLPDRVNLVLDTSIISIKELVEANPDACTFNDFDVMLNYISILAQNFDVYICGGAMLYQKMIENGLVDEVDITFVEATDPEATAFFPDLTKYKYVPVAKDVFWESPDTNGYHISRQTWVKWPEDIPYTEENIENFIRNNLVLRLNGDR